MEHALTGNPESAILLRKSLLMFVDLTHRQRESYGRAGRPRRTKVVSIFPNEAACLRLVSAVLIELDEEWQSDRVYLSFEIADSPTWP